MKKRFTILLIAILAMAIQTVAQESVEVFPGLRYQIMNSLELALAKSSDGHLVISTPNEEDPMQQWIFIAQEDGSYALFNEGAQQYVGLGTANAWDAQFYVEIPEDAPTAQYQLDQLDDMEGGWIGIRLMSNQKYLGTDGTTDGSWVYLDKKPSKNGHWKLVKLSQGPEVEFLEMSQDILNFVHSNMDQYQNVVDEVSDALMDYNDYFDETQDYTAGIEVLRAYQAKVMQAYKNFEVIASELAEAENLLLTTDYPGKVALQEICNTNSAILQGVDMTLSWLVETPGNIRQSINEYYMSQIPVATFDNPADLTMFIVNPSFRVERDYTSESTPSNEGWTLTYEPEDAGLDVGARHKYEKETGKTLTCYNGWINTATSLELSQQLNNLPDGRYAVQSMAFTWSGLTTTQHTFARTSSGLETTSGMPTDALASKAWEIQTTGEVTVFDGKLTIGFATTNSTGKGNNGSFLVTDFRLLYTGPVTEDNLKDVLAGILAEAGTIDTPLAGDRQELQDAIAAANLAEGVDGIKEAINVLGNAVVRVKASAAAYETFTTGILENVKNNENYALYDDSKTLMEQTIAYAEERLVSSDVYHEELVFLEELLSAYDEYTMRYVEQVMPILENESEYNPEAISYLRQLVADNWAPLKSELNGELARQMIEELDLAIENARLGRKAGDDADMTFRFVNNTLENGNDWWNANWEVVRNTSRQSSVGDHYSGDPENRYLNARSSDGYITFTAYNVIENLPNGIYRVTAACRADAEDAYLYATTSEGVLWKTAIPAYGTEEGEIYFKVLDEALEVASQKYGKTKQECYYEGLYEDDDIVSMGWSWVSVEDVEVKDHKLTVGISCDKEVTGAANPYNGYLISGDDFQLTYLKEGDNTDFDYVTAVNEVPTQLHAKGVYDLQGRRIMNVQSSALKKGFYIIGGKKVFVK